MTIPHGDMDAGPGFGFALGRCHLCKELFEFNPHTVVSLSIDPQTNRPPDVDQDGKQIVPDPEALARMRRAEVCNQCTAELNEARARRGMPPISLAKESSR